MVNTDFRSSMCNLSRLGNNIRDVCFKNDIDLHSLHTVTIGEMNNKIIGRWSESVNDGDNRVLVLCLERDSFNEWVFDKGKSLILLIFYASYSKHLFMYIILLNYLNILAIIMDV